MITEDYMNTLTKIGAMWQHRSKKDNKLYLSGEIEINGEKKRVLLFRNALKENEKHPDWNILLEEQTKSIEDQESNRKQENHPKQPQEQSKSYDKKSTQNNAESNVNSHNEIEHYKKEDKQSERVEHNKKSLNSNQKAGAVYWV